MELLDGRKLEPVKKNLTGMGGFLLFLCISLAILRPLQTFVSVEGQITQLVNAKNLNIIALVVLLSFIGLDILTGLLSLAAGIFLWMKKFAGTVLAKIFLISSAIIGICSILFYLEMIRHSGNVIDNTVISSTVIAQIISPVLFFIYLLTSVRVKNIYCKSAASINP